MVAFHLHPIDIAAKATGADANQNILSFGVLTINVMGIASSHHWNADSLGDIDRPFELPALDLQPIVHDFNEETIAESLFKPLSDFDGITISRLGIRTVQD
ncbi:MAG: hypothetical protein ACK53L_08045, partial [Pirellulaceae bacterium]